MISAKKYLSPAKIATCVLLLVVSGSIYSSLLPSQRTVTFVTWESLEPDKWASIWLIKRYINPDSTIEVRQTGAPLADGIAFGVPDSKYMRSGSGSTFESLLDGFAVDNKGLAKMGEIITAIETTAWATANDPLANTVEHYFRRLQDKYARRLVPVDCYGQFFDALFEGLGNSQSIADIETTLQTIVEDKACELREIIASRVLTPIVKQVPVERILMDIAAGKNVIFVDTREPQEYARNHIPGALNMPMRDIDEASVARLTDADLVVSYCIKDFRGYEVARKLLEQGVAQSVVMKPHGLAGWKKSGLPLFVASSSEAEAIASGRMHACARDRRKCT